MTVKLDPNVPMRPFLASCACGPQGNFATREEALKYLDLHNRRINVGVNTFEFVDESALAGGSQEAIEEVIPALEEEPVVAREDEAPAPAREKRSRRKES